MCRFINLIIFISIMLSFGRTYAIEELNYILQLRSFAKKENRIVYLRPDINSKPIYELKAGEFVQVNSTKRKYFNKIQNDKNDKKMWIKIKSNIFGYKHLYVNYHWLSHFTLGPYSANSKFLMNSQAKNNIINLCSTAKVSEWEKYLSNDKICKNISIKNSKLVLKKTQIKPDMTSKGQKLYYKLSIESYDDKNIKTIEEGWVLSDQVSLSDEIFFNFKNKSKNILSKKLPANERTLSSVLKIDFDNLDQSKMLKTFSRWTAGKENAMGAETLSEFFGQEILWNLGVSLDISNISSGAYSSDITQNNISTSLRVIAPIFLTIEVEGVAKLVTPLKRTISGETTLTTLLLRENLLFSSGYVVDGVPLKFTLGGQLELILTSPEAYEYKSLLGFQMGILREGRKNIFGINYGLTMNSEGIGLDNNILSVKAGRRLNPDKGFKSWAAIIEYIAKKFVTNAKSTSKSHSLQIGISKSF